VNRGAGVYARRVGALSPACWIRSGHVGVLLLGVDRRFDPRAVAGSGSRAGLIHPRGSLMTVSRGFGVPIDAADARDRDILVTPQRAPRVRGASSGALAFRSLRAPYHGGSDMVVE